MRTGWLWLGQAALLCLTFSACGGKKTISITSQEPGSSIALVPLNNPDSAGEPQKNPVTIPTSKLDGKALRVSAPGKIPQFWYSPLETSKRVDIRVRQLGICSSIDGNRNRPVRLLLKAYQGLSSEDFGLARGLALKAAEIDPTLAAPHIIVGLAYYKEGKKDEARLAFNKAKALDPEDSELIELLRMVE